MERTCRVSFIVNGSTIWLVLSLHLHINSIYKIIIMKSILLFVLSTTLFFSAFSQDYGKVRVTLKSGLKLEGKKGVITPEKISFLTDGSYQSFPLDTVQFISAKKGNGRKFAGYGAGGCAILSIVVLAASGGETTNSFTGDSEQIDIAEFLLGTAIWMGVSAGVGCIIGTLTDSWDIVYLSSSHSSILKRTKLNLAADPQGNIMFKLKYSF